MSSSHRSLFVLVTAAFLIAPLTPAVGQSSVAISPFVSYVPSAARNPLAGMALTFGGTTGLALRGSADISVANPDNAASSTGGDAPGSVRPWGADADAMLFLGGLGGGTTVFSRSLSPYLFSGIGLSGRDSAGSNVMQHGWSYGAGVALPLGFDADLFGEARWRMSEYVLPTSKNAPDSKSEMRFGLSFHVGGGSRAAPVDTRGRGRRLERYDDDVAVVAPTAPVTTVIPVIVTPSETVATTATESEVVVDSPQRRPVYTVPAERTARRMETPTVRRSTATATTTMRRARGIVYRSRVKASAKQEQQQAVTSTTKKTKREIMRRKRS